MMPKRMCIHSIFFKYSKTLGEDPGGEGDIQTNVNVYTAPILSNYIGLHENKLQYIYTKLESIYIIAQFSSGAIKSPSGVIVSFSCYVGLSVCFIVCRRRYFARNEKISKITCFLLQNEN